MRPRAGDAAPDFSGVTTDGSTVRLKDFRGKKLVLYFYPMDDTPGCTAQACSLRDHNDEIAERGAAILGVSAQDQASHEKFTRKHKLNFPLLADTDGKIADAFGVRREPGKNMARRASFLIGLDGKIAHVTDVPSADVHLAEMKEAVAKLSEN